MMRLCAVFRPARDERGSVLLASLVGVLVLSFLGVALMEAQVVEQRLVAADTLHTQALYMAESAINRVVPAWNGSVAWASCSPPSFDTVYDAGSTVTTLLSSSTCSSNQWFMGGIAGQSDTSGWTFALTGKRSTVNPTNGVRLTAKACPPAVGSSANHPCVVVQVETIKNSSYVAKYPFYADASILTGGSGALVDSFDSSKGNYNTTKCQTMSCGANLWTNGSEDTSNSPTYTTVNFKSATPVYGTVWAAKGQVTLSSGSVVYGNVTYDNPYGSCSGCSSTQVLGTYGSASLSAITDVPPVSACGPPYSSYSYVMSNISGLGSTDYNASTGALSTKNPINVQPGTYCFSSVSVQASLTIPSSVASPVQWWVTAGQTLLDGTIVNNTGKASYFQVLSSYTGSKDGVRVASGTQAYLYVYAPQTEITVNGAGGLFGAVVGYDIKATGGSQLHFDKALGIPGQGLGFGVGSPTYVKAPTSPWTKLSCPSSSCPS